MRTILKSINDRYTFSIKDGGKIVFSCPHQFFLIPSIKSSYKYAWQAYRDGQKLISKLSHHLNVIRKESQVREDLTTPVTTDISAESMMIDHYYKLFNIIEDDVRSARIKEDKESARKTVDMVIAELEKIREQITVPKDKRKIKKILGKFRSLLRMKGVHASSQVIHRESSKIDEDIGPQLKKELLEYYGDKICEAIQDKHSDAFYRVGGNKIIIYCLKNDTAYPLLRADVSENLNLSNITPTGDLQNIYPLHSVEFYQKYWKPIVENVGHFFIKGASLLLLPSKSPLPDIPKSTKRHTIEGWSSKEKSMQNINISFKGKNPIWLFESAETQKLASNQRGISKYTEQEYLNALVKCIDPRLKSIFERTGEVVEVIPHQDFIEVDIDFGRGLGIQRLIEKQIEIVS